MSNAPPSDFKARFTSSFSLFISSMSIHKNVACILSRLGDKVYLPLEDIHLISTASDLIEEDLFLSFSSSSFFSSSNYALLPRALQKKENEKLYLSECMRHEEEEKKRKEEERARKDSYHVRSPCDVSDALIRKGKEEEKKNSRYLRSTDKGVVVLPHSFSSSSSSLSREERDTCSSTTTTTRASESCFLTSCCRQRKCFQSSSCPLFMEGAKEKKGSERHTGIGANPRESRFHDRTEAHHPPSRQEGEKEKDEAKKGCGDLFEREQQWGEVKRVLETARLPLASVVQVWQVFLHAIALCREEEKRGLEEYKKRLRRRLTETIERIEKENENEKSRKDVLVKGDHGVTQKRNRKAGGREKAREKKEKEGGRGEEEEKALSVARIRREVYQSIFPITVKKKKKKMAST
ncbi:hypothetical protein CSUI_007743 [Cystoisospora suis]|uniref:Uncharacterized protein n=1 Tax=Cystoisospora suis TaxID=483139 RepID=A0A2C6KLK5_9APIC|nr:hypothetical protein CSUI_007743 [Cystoisospora suis]